MKILATVDPSYNAHLAVTKAVHIAKKEGAELTLLSVAEVFEDIESLFGVTATERLHERASAALDAAKAIAVAAGVTPKLDLETGVSPEEIIVDIARKGGFDLIVLGTRGKKGVSKLLLGSVSSRVAAEAPCSVLVVR